MGFSLEIFANDSYKILRLIYDNRICVKKDSYTPLSQQEIADIAHMSKLKTNRILNELKDAGFIYWFNGKRGKYALSRNGYAALELIQKMNDEQL